jgi:hypothetical protein
MEKYEGLERRSGKERRSSEQRLVMDRRTGFDRRKKTFLRSLADRPGLVAALLGTFLALNLADYLFTVVALGKGFEEANPFMALMFSMGNGQAFIAKMGMIAFISLIMWILRRYKVILMLLLATNALYALVFAYHLALQFAPH